MTLESAIARFLEYLATERNLAPSTVRAYDYDLTRFREYREAIGTRARLEALETFDIKDYLAHLREERQLKPRSLSRVSSSLRVFFRWASENGFLETNPALNLRNPKVGRKLPIYLVPSETSDVCAAAPIEDEDSDDMARAFALQDRAILVLLTMTGLRLAELVGLDCDDVDLTERQVRVFGKGRKERLVPLNAPAVEALRQWLDARPFSRSFSPALFLRRSGERISRRTVQHLVKKTAKALGLDPRLSPHKLRHTFATTLFAQDVDLRDIQELLGHSNIASTSIYTHTNVDKVREAVNQLKLDH